MNQDLKKLLFIFTLMGVSYFSKAQTAPATGPAPDLYGVRFSIGADAGLPTANLSNFYKWGIGGSLQADMPVISNKLFVTLTAGYDNFYGKYLPLPVSLGSTNHLAKVTTIELLPVKAGIKFFIVQGFYVQGEAGVDFFLDNSKFYNTNSTIFVYAAQLGYQIPLGVKNYIDAGIRYEATPPINSTGVDTKISFVGLRVAYGF